MFWKECVLKYSGQFLMLAIIVGGFFMVFYTGPIGNIGVAENSALAGSTSTFQITVGSTTPSVSNVRLNGDSNIVLTPNATTAINISFTVTDTDGCGDVFGSGTVTSTAFRTAVGSSCTASNLNCYRTNSTSTNDCAVATSATANATITVGIYYFAQATDASSSFPSDNWTAHVIVRDAGNATGSATSSAVELNTLIAINIQSSTIAYGTLSPGASSSGNIQVPFDNAGNSSTTLQISGTAMTSGSNSIPTSSQEYATSSFNVGAGVALSATPTNVPGTLATSPTSTSLVTIDIFWGILVPGGQVTGTYTGINTFDPVFAR